MHTATVTTHSTGLATPATASHSTHFWIRMHLTDLQSRGRQAVIFISAKSEPASLNSLLNQFAVTATSPAGGRKVIIVTKT